MNYTNYSKLMAIVLCTLGVWVGMSVAMTESTYADSKNEDASVDKSSPEEEESEKSVGFTEYTVKPGDYLELIAEEHDVKWPTIYEHNDEIDNPDLIYPEQEIEIPDEDIPLTRSLDGVNLVVPKDYAPAPVEATQEAPEPAVQSTQAPAGYASPQPTVAPQSVSGGVPGLNQVVGLPYVFGGTTLAGFDCSGLTQYLAGLRGIGLPRTVAQQYHATTRIGQSDLQPGDLVFFNWGHVGMYIGGGQIVHATNPAQGVRIDSLSMAIQYNGYLGAGRL